MIRLPIIRPNIDRYTQPLLKDIEVILQSNMLTNVNDYTARFEESLKDFTGARNVVAVSSATSGLILVFEALKVRKMNVILPSFTFAATAASLYWTSNKMKFCDIDGTFTLDPFLVRKQIDKRTGGVLAVHMYGNPAFVEELREASEENDIPLVIDAAHAIGASYHGKRCGSLGLPEVFSLSPTKLLTSVEGGIITTDDDELAERIRFMRNYGLDRYYESEVPGLNARMSEIHAAIGLSQVKDIELFVKNRNDYVKYYKDCLDGTPGISYQDIPQGHISSNKDFSIIVNKKEFGMDRDRLGEELTTSGVGVKKYFYPPVHRLKAYRDSKVKLPITDYISNNVLSLPIYNYMDKKDIQFICSKIKRCIR